LPELVAETLKDYEALVLRLARDAALLASVKDKLAGSRNACRLFDTRRSTRSMEAAYVRMWERHQSGSPAESFVVCE
jgi:protein O-GlcNAc transferase